MPLRVESKFCQQQVFSTSFLNEIGTHLAVYSAYGLASGFKDILYLLPRDPNPVKCSR